MSFSSVSVVGAGPVGCGVALACAATGLPVTLLRASRRRSALDRDDAAAAIRTRLERRLAACIERGEIAASERDAVLARIELAADADALADADLVIDVSACDPRARRATLATLETRLSAGAVLATACIGGAEAPLERLAEIAEVLRRPDQLVGMGFSFSRDGETRVELVVLPETAPGVTAACRSFCAQLGKTPLERASSPPRVGYREWLSDTAVDLVAPPAGAVDAAAE